MADHLEALAAGIQRWRARGIEDYWVRVSYLGGELNRFGDHELTSTGGNLWHLWRGEWREITMGSDFWLFSVPGAFAWARDMITKVIPATDTDQDMLTLRLNGDYGYVEYLQYEAGHRDAANFTFEVQRFEEGVHPEFEESRSS
jgi:hypothetical protein